MGIGPTEQGRGDQIQENIGQHDAPGNQDCFHPGRNRDKGRQKRTHEQQKAEGMGGQNQALSAGPQTHDQQGKYLEHKGKGDKRGDDAHHCIADPQVQQQLGKKGTAYDQGQQIFKNALGNIGFPCPAVLRRLKLFHTTLP